MIQLIAIIGAIAGFIAGGIGLFGPAPPETRSKTRTQGALFLAVAVALTIYAITR